MTLPLAKIDALDLVIISMLEHEKKLGELISKAEMLVNLLMTVTAKVELKEVMAHETAKYRIDLEIGKEDER